MAPTSWTLTLLVWAQQWWWQSSSSSPDGGGRRLDDATSVDPSIDAVVTTVETQLAIGCAVYIIFENFRSHKRIYLPRWHHLKHRTPPEPSLELFGWIRQLAKVKEKELVLWMGFDAYMALRFLRMCRNFMFFTAMWGIVVLIPVYYTGVSDAHGLYALTMANIRQGSNRLWVAVLFAYIFSLYFMYLLLQEYQFFVKMRARYYADGDADFGAQARLSVKVESIPEDSRSAAEMERFFDDCFPDKVHSAYVCLDLAELEDAIEERDEVVAKLEKAIATFEAEQEIPKHIEVDPEPRTLLDIQRAEETDAKHNTAGGAAVSPKGSLNTIEEDRAVEEDAVARTNAGFSVNGDGNDGGKADGGGPKSGNGSEAEEKEEAMKDRFASWPYYAKRYLLCRGREVESIPFYYKKLHHLNSKVAAMQRRFRRVAAEANRLGKHQGSTYTDKFANLLTKQAKSVRNVGEEFINDKVLQRKEEDRLRAQEKERKRRKRRKNKDKLSIHATWEQSDNGGPDDIRKHLLEGEGPDDDTDEDLDDDNSDGGGKDSLGEEYGQQQKSYGAAGESASVTDLSEADEEKGNADHDGNGDEDVDDDEGDSAGEGDEEAGIARGGKAKKNGEKNKKKKKKKKKKKGGVALVKNLAGSAAYIGQDLTGQAFKQVSVLGSGAAFGALQVTKALEKLTLGEDYHVSSTGFVTFTSFVSTAASYQMLLTHKAFTMSVEPAPVQKDIVWKNIAVPDSVVRSRQTVTAAAFGMGAIFWGGVVAFITAWSNLDRLEEYVTLLKSLEGTWLFAFLQGVLPVVALLVLISLLPTIFSSVSQHYEKLKLHSAIEKAVMERLFYYQMANIFVTVLSGSIFDALSELLKDPASIFKLLGKSLPTVATYFMSLVLVKLLSGLPIELARLGPLLTIQYSNRCVNRKSLTARELKGGVYEAPQFAYAATYANLLMILIICLIYCTISPLLSVVGAAYFGVAFIVYKYQFLYVYVPKFETGGELWFGTFRRCLIGLLASQITLIGYTLIREGFKQQALLVPLPFIVLIFWNYCESNFQKPTSSLSLKKAVEMDLVNQERADKGEHTDIDDLSEDWYKQPSMTAEPATPHPYRDRKYFSQVFEREVDPSVEDVEQLYMAASSEDPARVADVLELRTLMRERLAQDAEENDSASPTVSGATSPRSSSASAHSARKKHDEAATGGYEPPQPTEDEA